MGVGHCPIWFLPDPKPHDGVPRSVGPHPTEAEGSSQNTFTFKRLLLMMYRLVV